MKRRSMNGSSSLFTSFLMGRGSRRNAKQEARLALNEIIRIKTDAGLGPGIRLIKNQRRSAQGAVCAGAGAGCSGSGGGGGAAAGGAGVGAGAGCCCGRGGGG